MSKIKISVFLKAVVLAILYYGAVYSIDLSCGARLGLNVSAILGDTVKITNPRIGLNICGWANQWINAKFGLQEEVNFSFKGESWKDPENIDFHIYNIYPMHFTYLEIPILAKWRFYDNERINTSLYGGPNLSFPIVAEGVYMAGNTIDLLSAINPVDFGITAGLCLALNYDKAVIPVDIRYTFGLINFLNKETRSSYDLRLTHSVFSISAGLGWKIDLKKKKEF
jgi:hypothetical protein